MRSELGNDEEGDIFEGFKVSSEAMFGGATIPTAAAMLYASLAAGILGEEVFPYRHVGVDDIVRQGTRYYIVRVI